MHTLTKMATISLILLIFLSSAKTSATSTPALPKSANITSAEPGSSSPNDSTTVADVYTELTTRAFLSPDLQNETQTNNSSGESFSSPLVPRVTVPNVMTLFLKKPSSPVAGNLSPSRRQLFKIQGLDQILDKVMAGQSSSSDVKKLLDGVKDKVDIDLSTLDLFKGSSKADSNDIKEDSVPPEENSTLKDSSVEDMLRFICFTFGGNTYVTDVMDKSKQILDRIAAAYDVSCSPVVKAVRALLDIIICTFAGNANSAVDQIEPFKVKHFDVLFREITHFFRIPEKVAWNFLESAKKSIRQIMSFISSNRNMVDMMVGFLKPKDDPNNNQVSSRNFDFDSNRNRRRRNGLNGENRNSIVNNQMDDGNYEFGDGDEFENNVFPLQNDSASIVDTIKKVIDLSQALFRGRKSLIETMSLGQKAMDALSPFLSLDAHHAGVHRLVERLDKILCVMKDTTDSNITNDLNKLGRESRPLVAAVMEFIKAAGGKRSSSRLTGVLQMFLDRVASIVNSWESLMTSDYFN